MKLIAVGDLMLGDHPVCFGHGVRSTIESKGFAFVFKDIVDCLSGAEIVFGNLETILSDYGYDPDELVKAELRGAPSYADGLAEVGFNILNVANNHMLQHGKRPFCETEENIKRAGIMPLGLQHTKSKESKRVIVKDRSGTSVALLGFSMRPERYYDADPLYSLASEEQIIEQLTKMVAEFDGPVVVSLHWGEEYLNIPSGQQVDFARELIDTGACLVLGHHPHVLQGVERYHAGVIVYSLGNFVFDKWQRNPRESMIFNCTITDKGISDYSLTPIYISRKFQPQLARGKNKLRIVKRMQTYADALNDISSDDKISYHESAEKAYLKFRLQSYLYFMSHIYRYRPKVVMASLFRFLQRRVS